MFCIGDLILVIETSFGSRMYGPLVMTSHFVFLTSSTRLGSAPDLSKILCREQTDEDAAKIVLIAACPVR